MKLRNDEFYQKLFSLVIPIMIQSFMLALVSATDAIMLGFVDQTSLSAVSLAGQVQFVFNLFVMGITAGAGILAAQYWGKGEPQTIERIIPIALRIMVVCGGIFTLATLLAPGPIMAIFTNEADLIAAGAPYLRTVSLSYFLCGVGQIYLTVLKNTERAAASSRISSVAVILNIILNGILIFGLLGAPAMGIRGAAVATVVARAYELVMGLLETERKGKVRVKWNRLLTKEPVLAADFRKYTTPVMAASLVWGIAYTLYSVFMGHMGSDAVAANSVTSIVRSMMSCLIRGVGGGTGIMVGNVLGTGDMEKAKEYGRRLTHIAIAVGIATGLAIMLVSPVVVHFAPLSEVARGYLQGMMLFCGVNVMFQAVNHVVLDGIFCAGGDSKFDMIGNIFAMWCFSVPVGFLAAFVFKAPPLLVYCIVNLDEIVKIPAVYLRYIKFIWLRDLTR